MRGTVKIEQKAARYIDKPDMPPIVVRTCYDGDHFGDQMFFTARIGTTKPPQTEEEYIRAQIKKANENDSGSLLKRERYITAEEMKDLT